MDSKLPSLSPPPIPPGPGQRSLAAIVFTDVVSFSARRQADEETTLRLFKRDFDAMRDVCVQHHGSVLKTTGDGLLLYFSSAVQAVASALALQRAFTELTQSLKDPRSPVAGRPEARSRAAPLERIATMVGWLATAAQKYDRDHPLVVRELTGTAPKEIRLYVGPDRRLYYTEGGATRQRNWNKIKPAVLAAIVAGTMAEADPPPPREAVQGALAFAALYNLPELSEALHDIRLKRLKR